MFGINMCVPARLGLGADMQEIMIAVMAALLAVCIVLLMLLLRQGRAAAQTEQHLKRLDQQLDDTLRALDSAFETAADREETRMERLRGAVDARITQSERQLETLRAAMDRRMEAGASQNTQQLDLILRTLQSGMGAMARDNQEKLEAIRLTVDDKLSATLNTRLNQSFSLVNERLEAVYKGLGEMQQLASGVGDLKRVLTNVKTRGVWGEIQLDTLLSQVLSPTQYQRNAAIGERRNQFVDFAVCLPGKEGQTVFLPIDAKFPLEDYQRILAAADAADREALDAACAALENTVKQQAKSISEKYINPPQTTDFACMFLPTESLYSEVLRRPGLCELLQDKFRVIVTGPTTLGALLNSLQIGFKTLAIEKRSGEVWQLLGAVKAEFGKFGEVLAKTQRNLQLAVNNIDDAAKRTRAIERRLRTVEQVGPDTAAQLLGDPEEE
jgi:DNA recombination protein RmuC